jgi:hypothetical protein
MKHELMRRGWSEDDIIMIDADAGVSGTLRIDQREGMRQLFELITDGTIGTVACQDEDRLFRDLTMIQPNIFIEACKKSKVSVVTPYFTYEFHHAMHGRFHAQQFRMRCEMGADYINTVVIGKLAGARGYLMKTGRWAGAPLAIGYMVDVREFLTDGRVNPERRRIMPFDPYAEIILRYFEIFVGCGGSPSKTAQDIVRNKIFYPDPAACVPPDGYITRYVIKPRAEGLYPSRTGLISLLTNPIYIGHWMYNGAVVVWNNHEPIVPDKLFWQAFNYLSRYGVDGESNRNHTPHRTGERPSLDEKRPVTRPLCSGLLYARVDDSLIRVGTRYSGLYETYTYHLSVYKPDGAKNLWGRYCDPLDEAVVYHLHQRAKSTFDPEVWDEGEQKLNQIDQRDRAFKQNQLMMLQSAMQNVLASFETLSHPTIIKRQEERYEEMERECERLGHEIAGITETEERRKDLRVLRERFESAVSAWDKFSHSDKQNAIRFFVKRIEITELNKRSVTEFVIHWQDDSTTMIAVPPTPRVGRAWSHAEVEQLITLLRGGARNRELYEAFPDRGRETVRRLVKRLNATSVMNSQKRVNVQTL